MGEGGGQVYKVVESITREKKEECVVWLEERVREREGECDQSQIETSKAKQA